jgi:hypothetical protein
LAHDRPPLATLITPLLETVYTKNEKVPGT